MRIVDKDCRDQVDIYGEAFSIKYLRNKSLIHKVIEAVNDK